MSVDEISELDVEICGDFQGSFIYNESQYGTNFGTNDGPNDGVTTDCLNTGLNAAPDAANAGLLVDPSFGSCAENTEDGNESDSGLQVTNSESSRGFCSVPGVLDGKVVNFTIKQELIESALRKIRNTRPSGTFVGEAGGEAQENVPAGNKVSSKIYRIIVSNAKYRSFNPSITIDESQGSMLSYLSQVTAEGYPSKPHQGRATGKDGLPLKRKMMM